MKLGGNRLRDRIWDVSIPKRVLEALKLVIPPHKLQESVVSIPKRVLEALKLLTPELFATVSPVSIPKRVLEALKR